MVALTGIEPDRCRFSSVRTGLSSCVFSLGQFAGKALRAVRWPDVLPRCCPAGGIRLLAGNPELAREIVKLAEIRDGDLTGQSLPIFRRV